MPPLCACMDVSLLGVGNVLRALGVSASVSVAVIVIMVPKFLEIEEINAFRSDYRKLFGIASTAGASSGVSGSSSASASHSDDRKSVSMDTLALARQSRMSEELVSQHFADVEVIKPANEDARDTHSRGAALRVVPEDDDTEDNQDEGI